MRKVLPWVVSIILGTALANIIALENLIPLPKVHSFDALGAAHTYAMARVFVSSAKLPLFIWIIHAAIESTIHALFETY